jgi:hypothetical protein
MRKLNLNHGAGKDRHVFLARIMLGVGIVSMLLLVMAVYYVNGRMVLLQAEADGLRQPRQALRSAPAGKPGESPGMLHKEEMAAAQTAMAELALPWEPLFAALESIDAPSVKLLAVEPDARKGKLRITAEAAGTPEIIAYVQALDTQPMLQDVFLSRQERQEAGPYVFNIEAVWTVRS